VTIVLGSILDLGPFAASETLKTLLGIASGNARSFFSPDPGRELPKQFGTSGARLND